MASKISNLPETVPIEVLRASTLSFTLTFTNSDNSPLDITGQTLTLDVRRPGVATPTLTIGTVAGGIVISTNQATVTVSATQTQALDAGQYVYTLTRNQSGTVYPVLSGRFDVRAEVAA